MALSDESAVPLLEFALRVEVKKKKSPAQSLIEEAQTTYRLRYDTSARSPYVRSLPLSFPRPLRAASNTVYNLLHCIRHILLRLKTKIAKAKRESRFGLNDSCDKKIKSFSHWPGGASYRPF